MVAVSALKEEFNRRFPDVLLHPADVPVGQHALLMELWLTLFSFGKANELNDETAAMLRKMMDDIAELKK